MNQVEVRAITAQEVLPLRHAILRAGMPRESAIFPGDDAPTSRHFGAFVAGLLVGVATLNLAPFPEEPSAGPAYQVRGMATAPEVRGKGIGSELLAACLAEATRAGIRLVWCNARKPAAGFYTRHGFEIIGEEFEIPSIGPHVRMRIELRGAGG